MLFTSVDDRVVFIPVIIVYDTLFIIFQLIIKCFTNYSLVRKTGGHAPLNLLGVVDDSFVQYL
jgi:hypothetical protein